MAKKRSKEEEERIAAENKLLTLLNDREWSPRELSDYLAGGLSQVSYHVQVLLEYGLIELTRTEPVRGATEHFYRATTRTIINKDMAKDPEEQPARADRHRPRRIHRGRSRVDGAWPL